MVRGWGGFVYWDWAVGRRGGGAIGWGWGIGSGRRLIHWGHRFRVVGNWSGLWVVGFRFVLGRRKGLVRCRFRFILGRRERFVRCRLMFILGRRKRFVWARDRFVLVGIMFWFVCWFVNSRFWFVYWRMRLGFVNRRVGERLVGWRRMRGMFVHWMVGCRVRVWCKDVRRVVRHWSRVMR